MFGMSLIMLCVVIFAIGLFLLTFGVVGYGMLIYNRFVNLKNSAESTFHQIEVALKKRFDMINQLVEATRGYMKFEKDTMTKIAEMRSAVRNIKTAKDVKRANTLMSAFLSNLYAVMENYPDLKSAEQVQSLMNSIKDVETEISRLRYTYNNVVQTYNTMRETVPSNIVAMLCNFSKMDYLEFEEEIKERPHIDLEGGEKA